MRGADLLVATLAAAGVTRIFSLSGNQIMPVYDACVDAGIEIVHVRHEAAAVFMADAWAQLTGQVGVALVTAAPGAANTPGALYSARKAESPVLLLTGDSPLAQDGRGAFQELPQAPMTAPVTKLSFRAMSADALGEDAARAIRVALGGRPGPVHMALPFDVVEADATASAVPGPAAFDPPGSVPEPGALAAVADALARAERPLIVTGPALSESRSAPSWRRLAEALDAPVISMESPRGLKDPSLGDVATALNQADFVLSLGKPVDFTLGFGAAAENAAWAVIDAEEEELARARRNLKGRLVHALAGSAGPTAQALCSLGKGGTARLSWRQEVQQLITARPASAASGGAISPAELCAAVQRQIDACGETVVVCDGGEFGQWAQAGIRGTRRIINGMSGAIGGGLCYGVAAKAACPGATVFALMGDGTVGFHFAEFETAARAGLPLIVVIGNDQRWNAEYQIQLREYGAGRLIGCELSEARYDLAAAALGGHGEHVTEAADLDAALARAVASGKPACVDVRIDGLPAPSGTAH